MNDPELPAKAAALMERCQTCLLGSVDDQGYPAIWAMLQPREYTGMKNVIFSTNTSARHVAHYQADDKASLYFYDPQLFQGLLFQGRMHISREQSLLNRIWRDGDNLYYKLGPSDPDHSVMLFTAEKGRWYEDFRSTDFIP